MLPDWDKGVGWLRSSCFSWVQNFEPYSVSNISDSLQHQWEYIGESYVNFVSTPSDNASYLLKHKYIMYLAGVCSNRSWKNKYCYDLCFTWGKYCFTWLIFVFPQPDFITDMLKTFWDFIYEERELFFFLNVCMLCCKWSWYIVIMLKCFIFYSYII